MSLMTAIMLMEPIAMTICVHSGESIAMAMVMTITLAIAFSMTLTLRCGCASFGIFAAAADTPARPLCIRPCVSTLVIVMYVYKKLNFYAIILIKVIVIIYLYKMLDYVQKQTLTGFANDWQIIS